MKILAIDTASNRCSAALLIQGVVYERSRLVPQGHGEWILPMVDGVLEQSNITLSDLDAIAFGRGPGTFTGVRMAISVAQGLAFGADLALVPVSDLAMIAQGAVREHQASKILVAVDARMGEVYWASFVTENGLVTLVGDELICGPSQTPVISGEGWYACGTGWQAYPEMMDAYDSQVSHIDGERLPQAEDALPLARRDIELGLAVSPEFAAPSYLRDKVAWKN